jgi:hypothetical protein
MSVLRKRSPWIIPTVGLTMGLLALGLTGCGGGGSEGTPVTPTNPIPNQTIPAPPANSGTVTTTPVVAGQGATVTSSNQDPATTGGVTGAAVTVNPGSVQSDTTFGIAVRPKAESVITQAQNNGKLQNVTSVGELTFGPVGPDGKIDTSRPIVFSGTLNLTLTPELAAQVQQALRNGQSLSLTYVDDQGNLQSVTISNLADVEQAILNGESSLSLVLNNVPTGNYQVSTVNVHGQGGIG